VIPVTRGAVTVAYANTGTLDCYVPPVVRRMLAAGSRGRALSTRGTIVFADVSGFTRLSERLARTGNEGAEHLVDVIDGCFSPLLADAYAAGGSLLKFGGDALLLWFEGEGHPMRACAAAAAMRGTLRRVGQLRVGGTPIVLRMSVGVHSGEFTFFLVGDTHRELFIAGPSMTDAVAMEASASAGQILLSSQTAHALPRQCLGAATGLGVLLARAPYWDGPVPSAPADDVTNEELAGCFSGELRRYVIDQRVAPEHRDATVAFIRFGAFDSLVGERGPRDAVDQLDALARLAQAAARRYSVCVLGSDVSEDGGKILLSAGAPRAHGDDEERMLLTLREILDGDSPLPVSAGVNRGHVFAAEVGPEYRRTYAVMGDTVNVAARLMGKAPFGRLYATREVLERVRTSFRLTALEPLALKGKKRPLQAWDVGGLGTATPLGRAQRRTPLIGREHELELLQSAILEAKRGAGALVELIGETGSGKSRLLSEARKLGRGMRFVHTTCETYTRDTPYAGASDTLRQLLGIRVDATEEQVVARLRVELERRRPSLAPWLPLLAIAFGATAPSTPEVEQLASDVRAAKLRETVMLFMEADLSVPTLIQVEHAHLMDAASGAMLAALARELDSTSWLVAITRRDVPGGFHYDDLHLRLELAPLTLTETTALAQTTPEAHRLPPHVLDLAVRRSAGSPEFLLDLLAAAAAGNLDAMPASMGAAAVARLDELEPADRRLLCRAAVLGITFDPERLHEVLGGELPFPDEEQWQRLADMLARDPNGQARFKRPALQEAAYASLPYKLRRALHARVAEALEREHGEADAAVLSQHWLQAGDFIRAHRYAMLGAEAARERFSHADAVRLYRRAIEAGRAAGLADQAEGTAVLARAWEELGDALRLVGEPAAATRAFTEARQLLHDDPLAQARLCRRHAEVSQRAGSLPATARWLNRGIRAIEHSQDPEAVIMRARLHAYLGGLRTRQGRWRDAERACRQAIAEAESIGEVRSLAFAYYMLDWALVELRRPDEATFSRRALSIYRELGDPEHEATVLNNLGMFAYFDGLWDDAVKLYREAGRCSERAGHSSDVAYTDCNVGEILSDQGHYAEARSHLESARRVWSATGERQGVAFVDLLLGRLAARTGDAKVAVPLLEQAGEELRTLGVDAYAHFAQLLVAEAEAFAGDPERALAIAAGERAGTDRYLPLLERVCAVAYARLGRDAEAEAALRSALAAAHEREADYDVAACIDLLELLGLARFRQLREREDILERLRIETLPRPALQARPRAAIAV
jgi:class 3 adenylate cyclase/tetratricopeptide (TPR) repeat protein